MVTRAQMAESAADTSLHRYEDLLRATTAIAGYRDIETFRKRFAKELRAVIDFDYVLVKSVDPETHAVQWQMAHAPGEDDEEVAAPYFAPDESPATWVYEQQKPFVSTDWRLDTRYPRLREYLIGHGIQSSCALPLTTVHRRIGIIALGSSRPNAYSQEQIHLLSMVADHLAVAIDSALNLESSRAAQAELEHKNEQLELMLELTNRVVSNLELRDLLREVSATLRRIMKCDATGVALPENDHFRIYARSSCAPPPNFRSIAPRHSQLKNEKA